MQINSDQIVSELLEFINLKLVEHANITGNQLGECPIISPQSMPEHHIATLYICDETFHNAQLIASWFNAFGIEDLSIIQTLYDANNLDHELEKNERKWDVYFSLADEC